MKLSTFAGHAALVLGYCLLLATLLAACLWSWGVLLSIPIPPGR